MERSVTGQFDSSEGPRSPLRILAAAVLWASVWGCASAPERRPLQALVEEARVASQAVAKVPPIDAPILQASAEQPAEQPAAEAPAESTDAEPLGEQISATADSPIYADYDGTPFLLPQQLPHEGPLVSEIFVEIDVREALQILASQAQVSIIVDEQARGLTSATIENEPFEAALEKILLPLGYIFCREGDQYLVGVPDPASALFSRIAERHDYYTRHLSPSELMELLPEHLKRFVRTSEKRNLIIVEAPGQIAAEILENLSRSDQPVGQVVLEAFVCVISPESGLQFGLDLEQGIPIGGGSAMNLALSGLSLAGDYGAPGLASFAFTSTLIKSLAREGYMSIRAAPRVVAKDGETARISIAKESFFSVQPANAQFLFQQDIQKIEAGIGLDITPIIRGDHITVKIERAEVSEGLDSGAVMQQQENRFPIINRRRVETTVHVMDGETITIGGLVQRQQVERINRVPFLGDMPFAGRLFQRIDRREEDAEVIIFISPRIVREGTP